MARKFYIRTFGCQMNEADSERLAGVLEADGLEPTDDPECADVVVLNTCCIRENADNKLYGHLGMLKSLQAARPGVQIAVGGCLAQKDKELIQLRAPHVDAVWGTHNVGRAAELLRRAAADGPVMEVLESAPEDQGFVSALPVRRQCAHAAWVTIQVGCDNSCAFCIVPSVRGPEVSRPFGELVAEVEGLASSGVVEVTLLGQNVNSYGRDTTVSLRRGSLIGGELAGGQLAGGQLGSGQLGGGQLGSGQRPGSESVWRAGETWASSGDRRPRPLFADLLRAVGAVPGISRVRFTSPHPKDLRQETIAAMAETAEVCEHLHLPIQSGSDATLAAMRRGYTASRYLDRLAAARAAIDDLAVTTDLIVGFPGEGEDDFARTLEVVAEAAYDSAYMFIFSPRPGTRAAEMTEQFVPPEVVAERFERLKVVVERSALARHLGRVGRIEEVLVEGPSKRDPSRLSGRTRQNKLVHFAPPASGLASGSFARVLVTSAAPHHLAGDLVGRSTGGVRRRIPLRVG